MTAATLRGSVWRAGQTIGDYELLVELRAGGMATLFLARRLDPSGTGRLVAIKAVHAELARDPQFHAMFVDEALLSARIRHPGVVRVEELGEHEGQPYLVMELVYGCSLAQLMRALIAHDARLSPAFAVHIAAHVAEALHAAHELRDGRGAHLNVVHRDVSPENILLAYTGEVKLIDFGIAKARGQTHRTRQGMIKGKYRYMAPEQLKPGYAMDRRTDIYQLGIVLWEMLTRRRLLNADSDMEVLAQVRAPHVPAPSTLAPGVGRSLDVAVLSALSAQPAMRPIDAQAFARILTNAEPSALSVQSAALRDFMLPVMAEQRERDKTLYPPQVYAALNQGLSPVVPSPASARGGRGATLVYGQRAYVPDSELGPLSTAAQRPSALTSGEASERPPPASYRERRGPRRSRRIAGELASLLSRSWSPARRARTVAWFVVCLAGALLCAWLTTQMRASGGRP